MKVLRFLAIATLSVTLVGCNTTQDSQSGSQTRAKVSQLRTGMSQSQVSRIFGQPDEVDHDSGYHRGAYIPYYGWRGGGYDGEELKWEYKRYDLEVVFRRTSSGGWVVKEWDQD
jgi:hypothetical protein